GDAQESQLNQEPEAEEPPPALIREIFRVFFRFLRCWWIWGCAAREYSGHQFKRRIIARNLRECFWRRARRQGEIRLHLPAKVVEISFENRRLLGFVEGAQPEGEHGSAFFQGDLARRLGIANPLGPAAGSNQKLLASELEQVYRRRIHLP